MKTEIEEKLGTTLIEKRIMLEESAMIAKIEAAVKKGAERYCEKSGYQEILIPHQTKATGACENFSTLFSTDLFGRTAYLNQTGQLMLEAFMDVFEKTYCCGPSFRKELEADPRHLIEFQLFEIEIANHDLKALQGEINNIVFYMAQEVEERCGAELEYLIGTHDLKKFKQTFNAITYEEAVEKLPGVSFGDDLKAEHEQKLVKLNDGKPLFITHYPQEIKFFNMRLNRDDNRVVNSMDLLLPYSGEAVGAAEREENYEILEKRLSESSMLGLLKDAIIHENGRTWNPTELHEEAMSRFTWYMDIIKKHPIKHAGCGIGLPRITQAILQTNDIRYATSFPMNRETLF